MDSDTAGWTRIRRDGLGYSRDGLGYGINPIKSVWYVCARTEMGSGAVRERVMEGDKGERAER